jgi:isochorismate synthase
MRLVEADAVSSIASQLEDGSDGLRAASIEVDFDPFDFARTGASLVDRAVAYSTPWGDRLVGLGTSWHAATSGPERFAEIQKEVSRLQPADLKVFLGYSFLDEIGEGGVWADFSAVDAFVPRIAIERIGGIGRLTVVVPPGESPDDTVDLLASIRRPEWRPVVDPGDHSIESHPHVDQWAQSVSDAVKAIRAGEVEKVVLARSVTVDSSEPVPILRVFRELVRSYPQCYNFAWKSFGSVFMGASPELMVRVDGDRFRSNPLAGSAGRGEGEIEDASIGEALLASNKNQEEHRLVVDDMRDRLIDLIEDIDAPVSPSLKKMATVQHLSTEITGSVRPGVGILDLVGSLHPTPAVGGVPRGDAVAYIDQAEQMERGWYTGGVGWVTPEGEGAIAIALRCGLINMATTRLFAGAGIVADSDPAAEVLETRLKLRPLLDLVAAT